MFGFLKTCSIQSTKVYFEGLLRSILGIGDRAVQVSAANLLAWETTNKYAVLSATSALRKSTRGQRIVERGEVSAAPGSWMASFKGAVKSF